MQDVQQFYNGVYNAISSLPTTFQVLVLLLSLWLIAKTTITTYKVANGAYRFTRGTVNLIAYPIRKLKPMNWNERLMNIRDHKDVIEILKHISVKGTKGISTEALMAYYQAVRDLRFHDNSEIRCEHLISMSDKDNNKYRNTAVIALQLRGVKKEDLGIRNSTTKFDQDLKALREAYPVSDPLKDIYKDAHIYKPEVRKA